MTPLNAIVMTAGLVFGLSSVLAWLMLYRAHAWVPVTLWALGGLCFCAGFLLFADRVDQPRLPKYVLANVLFMAALILRAQALRIDLRRPRLSPAGLGLIALPLLPVLPLAQWSHDSMYLFYADTVTVGYALWLVRLALQVGIVGPSRSSKLLALLEFCWIGSVMMRILTQLLNWPNGLVIDRWDYAVFSVCTVVAAVCSNLAYAGMALDRSRTATLRALESQATETARRETAEHNAGELRAMLQQRDRLAAEREQLLQVLAHEIRQPLHHASGALQSATLALQSSRDDGTAQAAQRVEQAEAVLADVHSVLDNTLAATRLMGRLEPLTLQEVELTLLVELALGDLPQAERQRVHVQRQPGLYIAELEPGLVRLALRNLLRNAFLHGGPAARVSLHIAERADPPALCLSVADTGRGAPAALLAAVSSTAPVGGPEAAVTTGPGAALQQRGLGLPLVRRVMALHGGRLELAARQPQGLSASLVFPWPPGEAEPTTALAGGVAALDDRLADSGAQARDSGARNT